MVVNDLKILNSCNKGEENMGKTIKNSYTNNEIKKLALEKI